MNNFLKTKSFLFVSSCLAVSMLKASIRPSGAESDEMPATHHTTTQAAPVEEATPSDANVAPTDTATSNDEIPSEALQPAKAAHTSAGSPESSTRADAFIAGADWQFDGFVAGGQDSKVRSMFYLNDLLYLNIGSQQGIATGDKIEVYKRGDKVRDPQTGRFLGYEVRRAAVALATDRIEDDTCAVRIIRTHEPVEIGDLVRRIQ